MLAELETELSGDQIIKRQHKYKHKNLLIKHVFVILTLLCSVEQMCQTSTVLGM